jgi:NhaA family Na+:H+ antiporter
MIVKALRPRSALRAFLRSEAGGGAILMAAAGAALVIANSPLASTYQHLLHLELGPMSAQHWINEGLMSLFFLLVGLEIKREFLDGHLATWERRRLPVVAAVAGMAMPAIVYLLVAGTSPPLRIGWAIPAATDIAFAIGVLALLGRRAPASLKLFLTTVAIADDLGAVAIIAFAYSAALDLLALAAAALILLALYAVGRRGVHSLAVYLVGGFCLWVAVMLSGVPASVAGVLTATAVPLVKTPGAPDSFHSPLHRLEHGLAPWVGFLILPLFGFANAGITLGRSVELFAPLPLAIALGLFLGKQIGIFAAVRAMVALGLACPFKGATWLQVWGVSILCGIGFTMSLFIGALAFASEPVLVEEAKLGVIAGSFLSALCGYALLRLASAKASPQERLSVDDGLEEGTS